MFVVVVVSHYRLLSLLQGNWGQIFVEFNAKTKGGKNTATASAYSREENGAGEVSVPHTHIFVFISVFNWI